MRAAGLRSVNFAMIRIVAVLALVGAVLAGRALYEASQDLDQAVAAEREGDFDTAITHYRRALGWYVPASPYDARALYGLEQLAQRAAQEGRVELATRAYRAILAGLSAGRRLGSAEIDASLRAASDNIHALSTRKAAQTAATPPRAAPPPVPSAALSMAAFLGWLGFVACAFGLVLRGTDADGRLRGTLRWCAGLAACALVFGVSLWLA